MGSQRSTAAEALRAFSAAHPSWVLFDEPSQSLFDVAAGKPLRLPLAEVTGVLERRNGQTGQPYLLVALGDGRQIALADAGIAFPPLVPDVPQAPPMPPVVCLRDFHLAYEQLAHLISAHPEDKAGRQALDTMSLAIAILDGARRIGFDISEEERQLEALLELMEKG